jgi:phospholipid transport system substrate-binding protein
MGARREETTEARSHCTDLAVSRTRLCYHCRLANSPENPMPVSRRAILLFPLPAAIGLRRAVAAEAGGPVLVIQRFYDVLLSVMKEAKRLSFDQRYQRLAPTVAQTYNLALMTRLTIGPAWNQMQPAQQQALTDVFSRHTIALYAGRFDNFAGERFEVDPNTTTSANGVIVQSTFTKADHDKVMFNYLMRQSGELWQAIDVYLNGTISQLATQRSEYASVLQQGGADALVKLLDERIAALRKG